MFIIKETVNGIKTAIRDAIFVSIPDNRCIDRATEIMEIVPQKYRHLIGV